MLVKQIIQSFERKVSESNLKNKSKERYSSTSKTIATVNSSHSLNNHSVKTKQQTFNDIQPAKQTSPLTIPEVAKHTKLSKNYVSEFTLVPTFENTVPVQLSNQQLSFFHFDDNHSNHSQISDLTDTASWASSHKSFQDNTAAQILNRKSEVNFVAIQNTPDIICLREFLLHVCLNKSTSDFYLKTLVENNIRNLEELRCVVAKDECYLLNLGFDYILARDINDTLLAGSSQRSPSVRSRSSLSKQSISKNSIKSTSTREMKELLPNEIAKLYYKIISSNNKESFREMKLYADEQSNFLAKGYLMRIYALGQGGVDIDLLQAHKLAGEIHSWLKACAQDNQSAFNVYAKYLLGVCYSEGLVSPKNQKEAFMWYKQSAEQGYDAAQALVGHCFYTGQGVMKDSLEAVRWYKLSAAQGFAAAQCNLGICYELGDGIRKDISEAVKWYKLAADQGNCTAQYNLGLSLESGVGIKNNLTQALKYYKLAAEQGHPTAQFKLGAYYFTESEHLELLEEEAFYWLGKSSAQGVAAAHGQLGLCYERGIGIEVNLDQAIFYYQMGAEKSDPASLYHLAHCYYTGLGVDKNEAVAVEYYTKSAEKGHPPAQNNLGYCYFAGSGAAQNYPLALKWYRISAEHGYAQAQFNLGFCYEQGYGTTQKPQEAIKWYRLAANQGHSKAELALKRLQVR